MKTFTVILVALVMPFGFVVLGAMLGKRMLEAYRRRQLAPATVAIR